MLAGHPSGLAAEFGTSAREAAAKCLGLRTRGAQVHHPECALATYWHRTHQKVVLRKMVQLNLPSGSILVQIVFVQIPEL